tara:strand:- start:786 stop:1286 length:501 start_codon:yes stop_codon:yes gene_type:complete
MKYAVFSILFLSLAIVSHAQRSLEEMLASHNSQSIPYISVAEARMMQLHHKAIILDVRKLEEFHVSRIPSAYFFGKGGILEDELSQLLKDKQQPIIVYCSVGIRSETAAEKLKKSGFTNVRNLYGGIFEWKNEGYPVYDENGQPTEKVHTFSAKWEPYLKKGIKVH